MNRTYSHSFRPKAPSQSKNIMQRSAVGFRTLWKDRDTHQLTEKPRMLRKKTGDTTKNSETLLHHRQVSDQREMKDFVKMMKKESEKTSRQIHVPEVARNETQCRSSRSIRSETHSLYDNREPENVTPAPLPTLDELEKKIE